MTAGESDGTDGVTFRSIRMSAFPAMPDLLARTRAALPGRWLPVLFLLGVFAAHRGLAQNFDTGSSDRMREMDRAMIFFPPTPPPLGRLFSRASVVSDGGRARGAPRELADYINEFFYAPLSTRLARNDLPEKLREKLNAYRQTRGTLQAELRAELARLREADPAARQTALEALGRRQTPALADLEKSAEQLRTELIVSGSGWSDLRTWHLGEKNQRGDSPAEIAQVMRAAAYYQAGLSTAQRRLLREISLELALATDNATSAAAAQPHLFFSPEPARVLLPDNLPAPLAEKIAAYQTQKSALKKELYDAVYAQDRATFGFTRNNALQSLAAKHATRLAALDRLAEEIRLGLAFVPEPPSPTASLRSPFPPVLTARTLALAERQRDLQREIVAKLDALAPRAAALSMVFSYAVESESIRITFVPRRSFRGGPPENLEKIGALRQEIDEIAAEVNPQLAALVKEGEAIRAQAASSLGDATPRAVDTAFLALARFIAQGESEDAYREYRLALFEPGLSPEQRRLLFAAAVAKLELPLPRGELQPTFRAQSW